MSASKQKKTRTQNREEGLDKRSAAQQKADAAAKKEKRNIAIVSVVLVVVILFLVGFNSSLLYNNFAAVKVGNQSFTASEYSFFYKSAYQNYAYNNSYLLEYIGLDTSKSLRSQPYPYDNTMTWADFFKDEALSNMESVVMLYTEAQNEGFTLDEEQKTELQAQIDSYSENYAAYGYANVNSFLASNYGKGLNLKRVSRLVEMSFIASEYAVSKAESYSYTNEELTERYDEKKDDFDYFTYMSHFVSGAADEENDIDSETAMADAKALADLIISDEPLEIEEPTVEEPAEGVESTVTDDETDETDETEGEGEDIVPPSDDYEPMMDSDEFEFLTRVSQLAGATVSETRTRGDALANSFSEDAVNWLRDSARKNGDTTVIEDTDGYNVLFFVSRDVNDYNTVNVRHILAKAEADEDGAYTDEAKAAALDKINEIYAEWQAGDKTEDSFAALANEKSDDGGSNTTGGLYEKIAKGSMVAEFNDWIFDPARKTGDTGIVFNEDSNYCGYHIIYFVGEDDPYWKVLADNDIRNEDYKAWSDAQLENFNATKGFTAFLVR